MKAKELVVSRISRKEADDYIRRVHYSGKVVQNARFHFGVFAKGRLRGCVQVGSPISPRKMAGLFRGVKPSEILEVNRMALDEELPKNSESRVLGIVIRTLRDRADFCRVLVSYADATQCGDGTIYRASGFLLSAANKNNSLYRLPSGEVVHQLSLARARPTAIGRKLREETGLASGGQVEVIKAAGGQRLDGFQLRYVRALREDTAELLLDPPLDFAEIDRLGAAMYRGEKTRRRGKQRDAAPLDQSGEGGSSPTPALHPSPEED